MQVHSTTPIPPFSPPMHTATSAALRFLAHLLIFLDTSQHPCLLIFGDYYPASFLLSVSREPLCLHQRACVFIKTYMYLRMRITLVPRLAALSRVLNRSVARGYTPIRPTMRASMDGSADERVADGEHVYMHLLSILWGRGDAVAQRVDRDVENNIAQLTRCGRR